MEIGTLIFNNGLPFRKWDSREMYGIMFKAKKVPRENKIPSRETIRGAILDACYANEKERHTRKILNEAELFAI